MAHLLVTVIPKFAQKITSILSKNVWFSLVFSEVHVKSHGSFFTNSWIEERLVQNSCLPSPCMTETRNTNPTKLFEITLYLVEAQEVIKHFFSNLTRKLKPLSSQGKLRRQSCNFNSRQAQQVLIFSLRRSSAINQYFF